MFGVHPGSQLNCGVAAIKDIIDEVKPIIQRHIAQYPVSYIKVLHFTIDTIERQAPEVTAADGLEVCSDYTRMFHEGFNNFSADYIAKNVSPDLRQFAATQFEKQKKAAVGKWKNVDLATTKLNQRIDNYDKRKELIETIKNCLIEKGFIDQSVTDDIWILRIAFNVLLAKITGKKYDIVFDAKIRQIGYEAGQQIGLASVKHYEEIVENARKGGIPLSLLAEAHNQIDALQDALFSPDQNVTVTQVLSKAIQVVSKLEPEDSNLPDNKYYKGFSEGFEHVKLSRKMVGEDAQYINGVKKRSLRKCVFDIHVMFEGKFEYDRQISILGRLLLEKMFLSYSGSVQDSRLHILKTVTKYIQIKKNESSKSPSFLRSYGRGHGKNCANAYVRRYFHEEETPMVCDEEEEKETPETLPISNTTEQVFQISQPEIPELLNGIQLANFFPLFSPLNLNLLMLSAALFNPPVYPIYNPLEEPVKPIHNFKSIDDLLNSPL